MTDPYRPTLHFTPRAGWMNDPNGAIRVDGVWHLFFQHDPASINHGPMHWGHATSTDLVHWHEGDIALYPTALGTCFSGSAVETADGDIKLFYTAHSKTPEGMDYQVQCLVHADLAAATFRDDDANPVVPNPGFVVFRDPKVIWHAPTGRWVMLITEGQSIGFYGSDNLTDWHYMSSFAPGNGWEAAGPLECPDLVLLVAPGGEQYWVLVVSLLAGGFGPGSGTQYFVGHFDGTTFTNANPAETTLWLDYGRDYYAAQTFFDRDGAAPPTAVTWASNWLYARQTPTRDFRGVMTLPRELGLVETSDGLRVSSRVPVQVLDALGNSGDPATYRIDGAADLAIGEAMEIVLFGEDRAQFTVRRDDHRHGSIRTVRAATAGLTRFAHDYVVDVPWPEEGALDLTLFVDHGLVELCAAGGLVWITNLFFPDDVETPPVLTGSDWEVANV